MYSSCSLYTWPIKSWGIPEPCAPHMPIYNCRYIAIVEGWVSPDTLYSSFKYSYVLDLCQFNSIINDNLLSDKLLLIIQNPAQIHFTLKSFPCVSLPFPLLPLQKSSLNWIWNQLKSFKTKIISVFGGIHTYLVKQQRKPRK